MTPTSDENRSLIIELNTLSTTIANLATSSAGLNKDLRAFTRYQRRANMIGAGFFVLVIATLVIGAFMLSTMLELQHQNRDMIRATRDNGEAIKSCTTVEGECYQRLQRQNSNSRVVVELMRAIRCGAITSTPDAYDRCTRTRPTG